MIPTKPLAQSTDPAIRKKITDMKEGKGWVRDSKGHRIYGEKDRCGQVWCRICEAMITPKPWPGYSY